MKKAIIPIIIIVVVLLGAAGFVALEHRDLMRWIAEPPSAGLSGKFHVNVLIQRGDLSIIPQLVNQVDKHFPGKRPGDGHAVLRQAWWSSGCVQFTRSRSEYSPEDIANMLRKDYGEQFDELRVIMGDHPTTE